MANRRSSTPAPHPRERHQQRHPATVVAADAATPPEGWIAVPPRDVALRELLTPEEVMAATKLKRTKVYALLRTGQLKSLKIGKHRRIPVEWLDEWREREKATATTTAAGAAGAGGG